MRIFVTGAAGHVGSAIVDLLARQHAVVALWRESQCRSFTGVQPLRATLGDTDFIERVTTGTEPCDAIVHSAASLSLDPNSAVVSRTNCAGTQQVLELARKWKVSSLVYISSVQVIGTPREHPVTEDHPAFPETVYHASKLFGEHLMTLAAREGLRAISLRLTSPVGRGMRSDRIFPTFIQHAAANRELVVAGQGTRRQDYIHAKDAARAVRAVVETPVASGVYQIGRGESVSNLELARMCVRALGSISQIRFDGMDSQEGVVWDVSIGKARSALGFEPAISLEQTILEMAPAGDGTETVVRGGGGPNGH